MDEKIIICLCGQKYSGKDACADYICKQYNFTKYAFANKLKQICKLAFNLTDNQLTNEKETIIDEYNVNTRDILKFIGTDIFQYKIQELIPNVGKLFWVNNIINTILNHVHNYVIISDMRFEHEYDRMKQFAIDNNYKFYVIKLVRFQFCKKNILLLSDKHNSENEWKNINHDYLLINQVNIECLYKKIDNIMSNIL